MNLKNISKLFYKIDFNKIIEFSKFFNEINDESDIKNVNPEVINRINSGKLVNPMDVAFSSESENVLFEDKKKVLLDQKWFILAKSFVVTNDENTMKIISDRIEYGEEDIFYTARNIFAEKIRSEKGDEEYHKYMNAFIKNKEKAYEMELESVGGDKKKWDEYMLDAKATVIAKGLRQNEELKEIYGPSFSSFIDLATSRDNRFLEKVNNPFVYTSIDEKYFDISDKIEKCEQKEIDEVNTISRPVGDDVFDKYKANVEHEEALKQCEAIRKMQNERNNKPWTWKVFRFVSNIINYFEIKSAKDAYINKYIAPKYNQNSDISREIYQRSVENFENTINSQEEIKYQEVPEPLDFKIQKEENIINQEEFRKDISNSLDNNLGIQKSQKIESNKEKVVQIDTKKID